MQLLTCHGKHNLRRVHSSMCMPDAPHTAESGADKNCSPAAVKKSKIGVFHHDRQQADTYVVQPLLVALQK